MSIHTSQFSIHTSHYVTLPEASYFDAVPTGANDDGFPDDRPVEVRGLFFGWVIAKACVQIPYAKRRLLDGTLSKQYWAGGWIRADQIPQQLRDELVAACPDLKRWFA